MNRADTARERRTSRPGWVTGLAYALLGLVAVVLATAAIMLGSVYLRRRR